MDPCCSTSRWQVRPAVCASHLLVVSSVGYWEVSLLDGSVLFDFNMASMRVRCDCMACRAPLLGRWGLLHWEPREACILTAQKTIHRFMTVGVRWEVHHGYCILCSTWQALVVHAEYIADFYCKRHRSS
jgi:hypothetical protein